jgi:hypothetical protein
MRSPDPQRPAPTVRFARHLAGAVPGCANGGVAAGTLVSRLGGDGDRAVEVRLHRPIPLGRALTVDRDRSPAALLDGGAVIATASGVADRLTVRGPVSPEAARMSRPVVAIDDHPAPCCFVCGPANRRGLNLQPGALEGQALVATTWAPAAALAEIDGQLPTAVVWAALDCPSWYGAAPGAPALLGTIIARRYRPVPAGAPVVVSGWGFRRDGRKTMAGSAIHDADGELLAAASTTWIHSKEHDR